MKRAGIYLHVSTNNGQTTDNRRRELEAVAKRPGRNAIEVFKDNGVSGANPPMGQPAEPLVLWNQTEICLATEQRRHSAGAHASFCCLRKRNSAPGTGPSEVKLFGVGGCLSALR
jgi:hypothetical protein